MGQHLITASTAPDFVTESTQPRPNWSKQFPAVRHCLLYGEVAESCASKVARLECFRRSEQGSGQLLVAVKQELLGTKANCWTGPSGQDRWAGSGYREQRKCTDLDGNQQQR
jgi:hypothetical protein